MYDIFFVGKGAIDESVWKLFKYRFPNAQKLENVKTFEEVRKRAFTKMFWVVWDYLLVDDKFNLDYRVTKWDEQYIHVFKNEQYYDGICIFPKSAKILQKEWDYRFFTNKKEIDITASRPVRYDVVFISYHEPFAAENFGRLCPLLKGNRIHWVKDITGIHQAHIEAAKQVSTDMFYVVDADAQILPEFKFDYQIPHYDFNAKNTVHVWQSQNPVNGLIYGYGGVKLLPTTLTINMDLSKPDMTTSISKSFKAMQTVSNITAFNTDPFNSWKSAFRECAKLASRVIDRQNDEETKNRLDVWCTKTTEPNALLGAQMGRDYGLKHRTDLESLKKINDFNWLKEQFDARQI
jgi:hypothetical protein